MQQKVISDNRHSGIGNRRYLLLDVSKFNMKQIHVSNF